MGKGAKLKLRSKRPAKFHRMSDLPMELRLKIYENCMALDRPIEVDYFGFIERCQASSQLLRTCQEVHNDALSVLYGRNRFIAECFAAVLRFQENAGSQAAACVQHLVLVDWKPYTPLLFDFSVFQPFNNLKTLCLATEVRAQAPRSPPPCPAVGATIASRETKLLPKILPDIPRTILTLSQAENGLDITFAVIFDMFSRMSFPDNGRWCARRTDRYRVVATAATRTRNCNTKAGLLGTGYNLIYLSTEKTDDWEENFGLKGRTDPLMKYVNR